MQRKLPEIVLWQDLAGVLPLYSENRNVTFAAVRCTEYRALTFPEKLPYPSLEHSPHLPGINPQTQQRPVQVQCTVSGLL
jgi:hypothetical protein